MLPETKLKTTGVGVGFAGEVGNASATGESAKQASSMRKTARPAVPGPMDFLSVELSYLLFSFFAEAGF